MLVECMGAKHKRFVLNVCVSGGDKSTHRRDQEL